MKPSELLDSPEKWTTGELARDKDGNKCDPLSPEAVCWCIEGAYRKVNGFVKIDLHVGRSLMELLRLDESPFAFNDSHTFEEVRQVLLDNNL